MKIIKSYFKLSFLLVIIFLISGCQKQYLQEINLKQYKELISNKETFILEVMRTDCSACTNFKPKITQVAKDYKIEIKYINTDHLSEKEVNELYELVGISGTPTVIFYHEGEEKTVASRINGSVPVDKIISKFKVSGFIKE